MSNGLLHLGQESGKGDEIISSTICQLVVNLTWNSNMVLFFKFDHDSTSTMYHMKPWFEEWMITCSGNWVEGGDNQAGLWGPEKGDHMLATEMGLSSTVCNENGSTDLFGRTIATTCPGWAPSLANPPATCLPTKSKASRFWENHNSSSTSPTMTILGVQR